MGHTKKIKGELCAQALPRMLAGAHLSSLVSPRHGPNLLVRSKFLRISPTSRGSARRNKHYAQCLIDMRYIGLSPAHNAWFPGQGDTFFL